MQKFDKKRNKTMFMHRNKNWTKLQHIQSFFWAKQTKPKTNNNTIKLKKESLPPSHEAASEEESKSMKLIGTQKRYVSKRTPNSKRIETVRGKGQRGKRAVEVKNGEEAGGQWSCKYKWLCRLIESREEKPKREGKAFGFFVQIYLIIWVFCFLLLLSLCVGACLLNCTK